MSGMVETQWLCVEFAKTRGWEARDRSDDELLDYSGLLRWAERRRVLSRAQARRLSRWSTAHGRAAARAVAKARAYRRSMYWLLVAVAEGRTVEPRDRLQLNRMLVASARYRSLEPTRDGFMWVWLPAAFEHPYFVMWTVARSTAALLTDEAGGRLRLCASHDCGWLFVDGSRSGRRRWCSMEGCGNVEKARRYRVRAMTRSR